MTRDERILESLPVAERCAGRLRLRGADAEDARGVAMVALVSAADKFDPGQSPLGESGWRAFAAQRIRWALADWGRERLHGRYRNKRPAELLGGACPGIDNQAPDPADEADARNRKACTRCKRVVPPAAFYRDRRNRSGLSSWCRVCRRVPDRRSHRTAAAKAKRKAREARPDVRDRIRELDRERNRRRGAYRKTGRYRLMACRRSARYKLRRERDRGRRDALLALIARYDAELSRMDGRRAA